MFGKRLTLFKLLGFEVRIDLSWIIILVLVVWSLATGLFPHYNPGLIRSAYWWMGVLGALGLFGSIVVHELCHSLVARRFGLPMRGITLFIFGGVAEMHEEPPSPKAEFFMAIAGPLASIAIGAIGFAVVGLGRGFALGATTIGVIQYLAGINLILAAFNLVPAFPLDGGRVLRAGLWQWKKNLRWATRVASGIGSGFGLFLIFFGILSFVFGSFIGGIWWFLIGMFLRSASQSSYQHMLVRRMLQGEPVRRFMKQPAITVKPDTTVEDFVDRYVYHHHYKMFPVAENGARPRCVTTRDVKDLDRGEWSNRTVGDIAKPCTNENTLRTDTDAVEALAAMRRSGNSRFVVLDENGSLAGILTVKDLLQFLSMKLDLEEGVAGKDIEKFVGT
ncbi:MAG: CBS domain-containing protein [Chitinivibrionales bacterium]|nr:CBS domain-containing protein [Chitinivibrionales bacterium]MBD3396502.1 CBS domain-containing protein [Chitinivibrionales bacterium]